MAGGFKKIIDALNKPIGSSDKNSAREKNMSIKVMELTPADAIRNNKNIRYKYKVRDKNGNIISDKLDALSKVDVHSFLMSQGYDVLSIEEDKLVNKYPFLQTSLRQMSDKDLSFFLTQLSTYIKAGLPLIDSIKILSRQSKKKATKTLYNKLVFELTAGVSLSDAFSKQGGVFPKLLINMVKTSELTGDLTGVLDDMASYYKSSDENRKQIISAMTYPAVIFVLAIVVLVYIILYIVPQFVEMYAEMGSDLPTITKIIMNLSKFLSANIIGVAIGVFAIILMLVILYKNVTSFRYFVQWSIMHIPVVKNVVIYKEVIMFTKTFASLINYDVFITDSMEILGKITDNEIYKGLIRNAVINLSNGNGVSLAFQNQWSFPDVAYEMLVTGERTGRLGPMMDRVSVFYANEQKNLVDQLKSLIEPIMILFLAGMVGIVLLAVIVPMFQMYSDFS